jgi:hypothetical protein
VSFASCKSISLEEIGWSGLLKKTYWASKATFNWWLRLSTHDNSSYKFDALEVEHLLVLQQHSIVKVVLTKINENILF